MKIYTKSGDDGTTGLFQGPRVSKDDARIEACGTVDELCSVLGVVRSHAPAEKLDRVLARIQHQLFSLGAELGTPDPERAGTALLDAEDITWIEETIDAFDGQLPQLTYFVLPGGTSLAANLHFARAVCRRAERRIVSLAAVANVSSVAVSYLNRVGDLLFVLGRWANASQNCPDVAWKK